ncbi:MAG: hypothetical protein AAF806_31490 [Bacteroidota bacterium]
MTLQQLFDWIGQNPIGVMIFFIGLPILSFAMTWVIDEYSYQSPWKFFYSALIYAACIPGIFATMLVFYSLFFENKSLLEVNLFIYFLPILSMIAVLTILSRKLQLEHIPGFDKISGLVFMIVAVSLVVFLLSRMRIWTVFVGSIWHLLGLFVVLLIVFRVGFKRLLAKA